MWSFSFWITSQFWFGKYIRFSEISNNLSTHLHQIGGNEMHCQTTAGNPETFSYGHKAHSLGRLRWLGWVKLTIIQRMTKEEIAGHVQRYARLCLLLHTFSSFELGLQGVPQYLNLGLININYMLGIFYSKCVTAEIKIVHTWEPSLAL